MIRITFRYDKRNQKYYDALNLLESLTNKTSLKLKIILKNCKILVRKKIFQTVYKIIYNKKILKNFKRYGIKK